jgi:hypothetical protein
MRKDIVKTKKKKGCREKKRLSRSQSSQCGKGKGFKKISHTPTFGILHTCLIQ